VRILAETNGEIIAQNAHLTYVVRMCFSSGCCLHI